MNAPLAYLHGRLMPFAEATLPLHDAGFVSGATVVDNARTFRQRLFRWNEHLERFRRDCEACFVPIDATDAHLTSTAEELVAHNASLLPPGGELQLVTFATPGPLGFYLGEADSGPPTLGMATYPLPVARYRQFFTEGVALALVGHQPNDPGAIVPATIKHRSRMHWWVADRLANRPPHPAGAVALLTDGADGTITETGIANFLCVIGGCVTMPPPDRVLAGISLGETVRICRANGLTIRERPIPRSDVAGMSEAFLTGTAFGLAGVRSIDGHNLTWPGPVFRTLLTAWIESVGMDFVKQFAELGA
jgi:branched-chain amino acid aminotransferase